MVNGNLNKTNLELLNELLFSLYDSCHQPSACVVIVWTFTSLFQHFVSHELMAQPLILKFDQVFPRKSLQSLGLKLPISPHPPHTASSVEIFDHHVEEIQGHL
jgi:hypothetical protein